MSTFEKTLLVFMGVVAVAGTGLLSILMYGAWVLSPRVTAAPWPPHPRGWAEAHAVIAAQNRVRAEHGLPPLIPDIHLLNAARGHAEHMAKIGRMFHGDVAGRATAAGYADPRVGENVAWNYADVNSVMSGWLHSPGHRANILGGYRDVGAAVAWSDSGQPYWCVTFGGSR